MRCTVCLKIVSIIKVYFSFLRCFVLVFCDNGKVGCPAPRKVDAQLEVMKFVWPMFGR